MSIFRGFTQQLVNYNGFYVLKEGLIFSDPVSKVTKILQIKITFVVPKFKLQKLLHSKTYVLKTFFYTNIPSQENHKVNMLKYLQILCRVLNTKKIAPELGSLQCEMLVQLFFCVFLDRFHGEFRAAVLMYSTKLDGKNPLVADPSPFDSTTLKNPHICKLPTLHCHDL